MKHKYKIAFGISSGVVMGALWSVVFSNLLGVPGIFIGICFGVSFALCGYIIGAILDKHSDK